jgi:hypothetical protein
LKREVRVASSKKNQPVLARLPDGFFDMPEDEQRAWARAVVDSIKSPGAPKATPKGDSQE